MRQSVRQSSSLQLGQVSYWIRPKIEATWQSSESFQAQPAVVINVPHVDIDQKHISKVLDHFTEIDDVYQTTFRDNSLVVLQCVSPGSTDKDTSFQAWIHGSDSVKLSVSKRLPEGPYFMISEGSALHFHQTWRLYEDSLDAFVTSTVPRSFPVDGKKENCVNFEPLPVSAYEGLHHVVAVPSRLYSQPTANKPLDGVRISVKDNMHLAGVVTTLGSRSFAKCEGTQHKTSEYISELVIKGAIIVGKTKLSAYAGSEVPPNQPIDYFPPWNPRGDGYQGPSGSSSGAGASAAGYEWLDVALCTDTTGSMRYPASSHGLWGQRFSWDTVSMDGVVPSVPVFDTWAALARNPKTIEKLLDARSPSGSCSTTQPNRILYPTDWYPLANKEQQKMTEDFLAALESALGVQHKKISLKEEWQRTAPEELRSKTLPEYMAKSVGWVNGYDGYHSFDDFRKTFRSKFDAEPYASPSHRVRWVRGAKITKEERDQGLAECDVFKAWIKEKILQEDEEGRSRTVMLVPLGRSGANYRDVEKPLPDENAGFANGYDEDFLGSVAQLPQVVVPIGQNPYQSRISERTEYAPIVTTLLASRGSDKMLLEIAYKALKSAGWPTQVQTGRLMFAIGDNSRNSKDETKD